MPCFKRGLRTWLILHLSHRRKPELFQVDVHELLVRGGLELPLRVAERHWLWRGLPMHHFTLVVLEADALPGSRGQV